MSVLRRSIAFALAAGALLASAPEPAPAQTSRYDFQHFSEPAPGPAAAVGSYTNGCMTGASAVALDGVGYMVVRPGRNRYFGHPDMVTFLTDLGFEVERAGLGTMLIADVSMPRGGPFLTGHTSHQIGLDADVWFRLDIPRLPVEARDELYSYVMIDPRAWVMDYAHWGDDQAELLRLAASDPRVARIFVHPVIKREMCERSWSDRSFLRTIRPWFGHDSHFHVRLHCPDGDPGCVAQAPPPEGDGCGAELMSWWPDPTRPPAATPTTPREPPPLPSLCQVMLQDLR